MNDYYVAWCWTERGPQVVTRPVALGELPDTPLTKKLRRIVIIRAETPEDAAKQYAEGKWKEA